MSTTLLQLSLTGGSMALCILVINWACRREMTTRWRRLWLLVIPLAFLLPVHARIVPDGMPTTLLAIFQGGGDLLAEIQAIQASWAKDDAVPIASGPVDSLNPWMAIWITGAVTYLSVITIQTVRASRRWARERLSTDSSLLALLEDCKAEAGVLAPIGLVISQQVRSPALLGWLRPRILIPASLSERLPREQLRAIILHELAHFRNLDIPTGWLFTLVCALHWFNPLAHLTASAWRRFREEAADETAVRWMAEPTSRTYEEALLAVLKSDHTRNAPFGALALGESFARIKQRFHMIQNHPSRSIHTTTGITIALVLLAAAVLRPVYAEETSAIGKTIEDATKKEAVEAMTSWMAVIDMGDYAKSWTMASKYFRDAVTEEQWIEACKSVRTPLGKRIKRELASVLHQKELPQSDRKLIQGNWMIAQFETSFENARYTIETVTFEKEKDGVWRASGYYIKPK